MRLLALLLAVPMLSFGQNVELSVAEMVAQNKEQLTRAINALSRCAAVYEIAAMAYDQSKPATAETWRGTSRGARAAAIYLLGMDHVLRGEDPKPYGDFAPYVGGIIETSAAQVLALLDNDNAEAFQLEIVACVSLAEMQRELVQEMRDECIGRRSPACAPTSADQREPLAALRLPRACLRDNACRTGR